MRTGRLIPLLVAAWLAACTGAPPAPDPAAADVPLVPDTTRTEGTVPRNTTLDAMLRGEGLGAEVVQALIEATSPVFDPRRLRSEQPFALVRTVAGALRYFEYEIDADTFLRVMRRSPTSDTLQAELVPIPKTLEIATVSGTIGGNTPSLFQAMAATGEGPDLAIAMAEIFAGEIDFNTELQPDDRFILTFERFEREGRPSTYGAVTAAEFHNEGRVLRAIRFTPPGGKPDYFDENGRSLQRFFLRSPLKFEPRITSGFSASRMHPVLHTARAHRGVDYAAPTGAPVVAIAAGTVLGATTDNTNGRMVRIRHASGYESNYLHLSAFAPGMRAGAHVAQGQLIGRVGATGLATGPHLHYALKKNGAFVNPLREHRNLPPGDPVPPAALAAFGEVRDLALQPFSPQRKPDIVTVTN
jgi:murein DD-endopeptidase MepM/ murein hydrolase activator NlpD